MSVTRAGHGLIFCIVVAAGPAGARPATGACDAALVTVLRQALLASQRQPPRRCADGLDGPRRRCLVPGRRAAPSGRLVAAGTHAACLVLVESRWAAVFFFVQHSRMLGLPRAQSRPCLPAAPAPPRPGPRRIKRLRGPSAVHGQPSTPSGEPGARTPGRKGHQAAPCGGHGRPRSERMGDDAPPALEPEIKTELPETSALEPEVKIELAATPAPDPETKSELSAPPSPEPEAKTKLPAPSPPETPPLETPPPETPPTSNSHSVSSPETGRAAPPPRPRPRSPRASAAAAPTQREPGPSVWRFRRFLWSEPADRREFSATSSHRSRGAWMSY